MFTAVTQTVCSPLLAGAVTAKPWFLPVPGCCFATSGRGRLALPVTGFPPSTLTWIGTGLVFESGSMAQPVATTLVEPWARPTDSYLPYGSNASVIGLHTF